MTALGLTKTGQQPTTDYQTMTTETDSDDTESNSPHDDIEFTCPEPTGETRTVTHEQPDGSEHTQEQPVYCGATITYEDHYIGLSSISEGRQNGYENKALKFRCPDCGGIAYRCPICADSPRPGWFKGESTGDWLACHNCNTKEYMRQKNDPYRADGGTIRNQTGLPDSLEHTDDRIIIEFDTWEQVDVETPNNFDAEFETEGTLTFTKRLGNGLLSIDYYFDPDCWNGPNRIQHGDTEYHLQPASMRVRFDIFESSIRKAARKRATEDNTHPVRVLADWLWQTRADHLADHTPNQFLSALRDELYHHEEEGKPTPDWALCRQGDPENWRHEMEPVTDLDEAKTFAHYDGFDAVREARNHES